MKMNRRLLIALMLIFICTGSAVTYAEDYSGNFVDKWVYETPLFEEDPADEFINEKQDINRLCTVDGIEDINTGFDNLYGKFQELKSKEIARYGEKYVDWDWGFASARLLSWDWEWTFTTNLQRYLAGYTGNELKKILQDENTWKNFQVELNKVTHNFDALLELNFRIDKSLFNLCEEVLGESDPVTLKREMYLIHDYSLLGDSKTALETEKNLLPKMKKTFGENSREVVDLLTLMANDYEILGNYGKSEETLLKSIAINKELHGDESSPELVANLVALNRLIKAKPDSDTMLALEKAAKNLPEDDLYTLGYFRVKILTNPVNDMKRLVDLGLACAKERNLIETYRGDDYIRCVDMSFEQGENAGALGLYWSSLVYDLTALSDCKLNLGNYHHKTLTALCHLSEDYLTLAQSEDALALAREAFKISQKLYGDEHPCTLYTIHSLTNVYRKKGLYNEALAEDMRAYKLSKKVFIKNSVNEPQEIMRVLSDIADDYKGLKNYPAAIKYYEQFLSKSNDIYAPEVSQVRKNLAYLYNVTGKYDKTVNLYDFLRTSDNSYSLDGLKIDGLTAAHTADILGEALTAVGKKETASQIYSQEITKFEVIRYFNTYSTVENKRKWFAQTVPYYKRAASFFVSQNKDEEAFRAAELCKGRTLADQYNDLLAIYKGGLNEDEILKLNDYREKIFQFRDNFSEDFQYGSEALKFNLRVTQLEIMDEYDSYIKQLGNKYPIYKKILTSGRIDTGVKKERFFNPEQIKDIIPKDHCYISFSVVKKDENSNTLSNEILAFVADDSGQVKSFSITVDDKFFDQCKFYHDLNSYAAIRELNNDGKYLWLVNGEYVIAEGRENKPVSDAVAITAKNDPDRAKWHELRKNFCAELSEKLISKLETFAGTSSHWIISPDAELNLVPFETLIYHDKMLIESVDVSYVPSLAVMNLMKEAEEKNSMMNRKELFAMGDPIYENSDSTTAHKKQQKFFSKSRNHSEKKFDRNLYWDELKSAALELDKVSPLFKSKAIFRREQVTEKNLWELNTMGELSKYKYLLFSTHGFFDTEKPEYSSIVLSQKFTDDEYDGYVTVGEWMSYDLRSDLVYLSACESGRGSYQAGEGIVGIPYALTVAGNKDTVMSLWKVKDIDATAEFTSAVFKKLRDGKSEVAALNETKREFLNKNNPIYRDPSVWAAFLLYGI